MKRKPIEYFAEKGTGSPSLVQSLQYILIIATVLLLTLVTQVGGIIFIGCIPVFAIINKGSFTPFAKAFAKILAFLSIYILLSFTLIPLLAQQFGRVPMPVWGSKYVKPLNIFTCLLNRHYVKPALKASVENVAEKLNQIYPGSVVLYLDANFPFIKGFPLLPHLSHNDGNKLDVAFFYIDPNTGRKLTDAPSWIGYGICEEPVANEENRAEYCEKKGYWQYSIMQAIVPQWNKSRFSFDEGRTKKMVSLLAKENVIKKIFIEPHLKIRMELSQVSKIRFHGCQAVRHDDHIHIQL